MQKRIIYLCIISVVMLAFEPACHALNFRQANTIYTQSAMQRAKYYPQNAYANRYRRQRPSYIFTPQQARYYGYRMPQQTGTYNPYYYNRR